MSNYDPSNFRPGRPGWTGQVGKIAVVNTTDTPVEINLYHPDSPSGIFGNYKINPDENIFLLGNDKIGMDWGIQVDNSEVRIVGLVSDWNEFEGEFIFQTWPARILANMPVYNPAAYRPGTSGWTGEIGKIAFINLTEKTLWVKLYHPDAPGIIFGTYTVEPGANHFLADGANIGMDWGIQVDNSEVRIVGLVSDWNEFEGTYIFQTWPKKILMNARQRLQGLGSAFKELEDFIAFSYDAQTQSIGVRIGKPIFYNRIDQIPTQVIRDTKFNYEEAKWFKFAGIDVGERQILINFRFRKKHWEDALLGKVLIYDNAADVKAGINLEVYNRVVKGHPFINDINSDWASGLLGWVASFADVIIGSISWIFTGNFTTLTDTILDLASLIFNVLSAVDKINLEKQLRKINEWNQAGLIFLDRTEYDPKGVWLFFKIDPAKLDDLIDQLEEWVHSLLHW